MLNIIKKTTKKSVNYGPISAITVTLAIYFGSQILAGVIVSLYGVMNSWTAEETIRWIEDSVLAQFWYVLGVEVLTLALLYVFVNHRRISWKSIGLGKPTLPNLAYAVPGYVVYFLALVGILAIFSVLVPGLNFDQDQEVGFKSAQGLSLGLVFVSLVILPAFVEEILVRGFLYGGLRNKLPKLRAALITSIIFAVAHLQLSSGSPPLWVAAIDTFVLSLVLIGLREKTGNIWAGVVVHFAKNSLAFLSIFVFTGLV